MQLIPGKTLKYQLSDQGSVLHFVRSHSPVLVWSPHRSLDLRPRSQLFSKGAHQLKHSVCYPISTSILGHVSTSRAILAHHGGSFLERRVFLADYDTLYQSLTPISVEPSSNSIFPDIFTLQPRPQVASDGQDLAWPHIAKPVLDAPPARHDASGRRTPPIVTTRSHASKNSQNWCICRAYYLRSISNKTQRSPGPSPLGCIVAHTGRHGATHDQGISERQFQVRLLHQYHPPIMDRQSRSGDFQESNRAWLWLHDLDLKAGSNAHLQQCV